MSFPEWAADLYVIPRWPTAEEMSAKHEELRAEAAGSRYPGWAAHSSYRRWLDQHQPHVAREHREEFRRREAEAFLTSPARRVAIREWLDRSASFV